MKTYIYKFYICYTHAVDGQMGKVREFPANSDGWAEGVASGLFDNDENSHFGLLVKKDGKKETVVSTYEHQVM